MKYLPLIWRSLMRRKVRTLFTLLSIVVAFLLYGLLATIKMAFGAGVEIAGADRLLTIHKVSIVQLLPLRYEERIAATEGVEAVTHATWFGGIYQDPKNFFAQMAVDPESFLDLYPEYVLSPEERASWLATRAGAIAGRKLAERFGWKPGDRIPIQGTFWRPRGGGAWEFTLSGIYEGAEKGVDESQFFFHQKFLDEGLGGGLGLVGWYIVRVRDPEQAAAVAERIDRQFANSAQETKTSTEKAFVQAFANQVGDTGAIVTSIIGVVLFVILLVAGNTVAQSVRERTGELAVLKTLGYGDLRVLTLVLAESTLLAGLGGGLGLLLAWLMTQGGDPTGGFLPVFYLPGRDLAVGGLLILTLGLVSGSVPALMAMRLDIVEALRRN